MSWKENQIRTESISELCKAETFTPAILATAPSRELLPLRLT